MIGAGLLAKKAVEKGLAPKPWVKTSLAPGSKVVTDYLEATGVMPYLEKLGFNLVGYGCTTCIGNSGPLPDSVSAAVKEKDLVVAAVLSGNRNFEGRVNAQVKANYLASPPLVVAYALAGHMDFDPYNDPIGSDKNGKARLFEGHLADPPGGAGGRRQSRQGRCSRRNTASSSKATIGGKRCLLRRARFSPGTKRRPTLRIPPISTGMDLKPAALTDIVRSARPGRPGGLGHHRPHLSGGVHPQRQPGRKIPSGARRSAQRL